MGQNELSLESETCIRHRLYNGVVTIVFGATDGVIRVRWSTSTTAWYQLLYLGDPILLLTFSVPGFKGLRTVLVSNILSKTASRQPGHFVGHGR